MKHFEREEDSGESVGVSSGEYETLSRGGGMGGGGMKGSVSRSRESDEREQSRERRKAAGGKKRNEKSKNATHFPFAPFLQSTLAFSPSQILNHLVSNPHDSFRTHTRPNQMSLIQHLSILIRSNSILRTSLRTLSSPASAHVFQDVRMREEGRYAYL